MNDPPRFQATNGSPPGELAAVCILTGALAGAVVFALLIVVVEHYQGERAASLGLVSIGA